jgi:TfoX/Sxy family transcriptional regulator of competence genes
VERGPDGEQVDFSVDIGRGIERRHAGDWIMAFDETLAARIRKNLARRKNVENKKMFGGIGFLPNGNMLVGVWKDSLIARVGSDEYDHAVLEPHVKEFDITGKPMKGWVLVEPQGVVEDEQLSEWIQRALKFVGKLPAK